MADGQEDTDRSEDPTQKRLDEALERGDVVKSQEVNTWFVLAGGTLILMVFSGTMASGIAASLRGLVANSYAIRVEGRSFSCRMRWCAPIPPPCCRSPKRSP